jgi:hypothetical protein
LAPQVPTTEPAVLVANTTWEWTKSLSAFPPADNWSVSYYLTGKTSLSFAATPNVSDGTYSVSVPVVTTATVSPGVYRWVAYATLSGKKYVADSGQFTVQADPTLTGDQRTFAEKMLALFESEIAARVAGDGTANEGTTVDGFSVAKMSMRDLYRYRNQYKSEVIRQRRNGRLPGLATTFGNARSSTPWWNL